MKGKGRGVTATQPFKKGEFLCEYSGDLISREEAEKNTLGIPLLAATCFTSNIRTNIFGR